MSTPSVRPSTAALVTLLGSALTLSSLALYQWVELLVVRAGGTPVCAVNDTINCATVWNTPFASRVHELTGMPVAGLGLAWGLTATVLAAMVAVSARRKRDVATPSAGVKLWAFAGALTTVTMVTASVKAGAVCLTCLGTYALVIAYCVGAFAMLPGPAWPKSNTVSGAGWALVLGAVAFLALLYPGLHTPKNTEGSLGSDSKELAQLVEYLNTLPPQDAQRVSLARAEYLSSPPQDSSRWPARLRLGPADAPLRIVEFSDVLCGHCAQFEAMMHQLLAVVPPSRISLEPRYFPLDGQCNQQVKQKGTDNVRCLGAKVQVCLESSPKFWEVRQELFERQNELTEAKVLEIALKSGVTKETLQSCVNAPQTQEKLDDDAAYAMAYQLEGTPLVVLNGRKAPAYPPFLLGMALANGDVNAPYFQKLPPPPPQ